MVLGLHIPVLVQNTPPSGAFGFAKRCSELPEGGFANDFGFQPSLDDRQIRELRSLRFIHEASNVIFLGPPGVGKTHLSVALAEEAIRSGLGVFIAHLRWPRAHTLPASASPPPARSRCSKYGLNASSLLGGAERGPYSGANPAACMYLRIVLRSQPVNLLMAWMLIPCRCSSLSSCTSLPLNKFRNLLRMEWLRFTTLRGGENSTGTMGIFATALT